jgi:hypothetical protein
VLAEEELEDLEVGGVVLDEQQAKGRRGREVGGRDLEW